MDYIFYQMAAINGFDEFGHYLRASLLLNLCSTYATVPDPACAANFQDAGPTARAASSMTALQALHAPNQTLVWRRTQAVLRGMSPKEAIRLTQGEEGCGAPAGCGHRRGCCACCPGALDRQRSELQRSGRRGHGPRHHRRDTAARLPPRGTAPMRPGGRSIAANPVLIGAATTLVILVAVFLAYNANQGLPFVPTYSLKVNVPSAANLVRGNEVRVGGARVGIVDEITPLRHPTAL